MATSHYLRPMQSFISITKRRPKTASPHDSLSPQDEKCNDAGSFFPLVSLKYEPKEQVLRRAVSDLDINSSALPHPPPNSRPPTSADPNLQRSHAPPPSHRTRRPPSLNLARTNGFTQASPIELKQQIRDACSEADTNAVQVARLLPDNLPPTPTTPFVMGHKPSAVANESSMRDKMRALRKPSFARASLNPFRRTSARQTPPQDGTTDPTMDHYSSQNKHVDSHNPSQTSDHPVASEQSGEYDARGRLRSASTSTITNQRPAEPLSPSGTIKASTRINPTAPGGTAEAFTHDGSPEDSHIDEPVDYYEDTHFMPSSRPAYPTLPLALRGVPQNQSRMTASEPMANPGKARIDGDRHPRDEIRGTEQTQWVSSTSTSADMDRRDADSIRADQRNARQTLEIPASRWPDHSRPSSSSSSSAADVIITRPSWGNGLIKSSEYAYAIPLNPTQVECSDNHARLMLSRNKYAPVECAVCHVDDPGDHWMCVWCATRLCGVCKADFSKRGMKAVQERIRKAETDRRQQPKINGAER